MRSQKATSSTFSLPSPCEKDSLEKDLEVSVKVEEDFSSEYCLSVDVANNKGGILGHIVIENIGEYVILKIFKPTKSGHDVSIKLDCEILDGDTMY